MDIRNISNEGGGRTLVVNMDYIHAERILEEGKDVPLCPYQSSNVPVSLHKYTNQLIHVLQSQYIKIIPN
jgi:hypothetical protein